jgi:hypothetical protein
MPRFFLHAKNTFQRELGVRESGDVVEMDAHIFCEHSNNHVSLIKRDFDYGRIAKVLDLESIILVDEEKTVVPSGSNYALVIQRELY